MVNKIIELLVKAKREGIDVVVNDGQLQLKFPPGLVVDPRLIEGIREHKKAIIDYLSDDAFKATRMRERSVVAWPRVSGEAMPLSFAQERLWFIDRLQGSVQYHMPWVFRLEGDLRPERLGEAFDALVQRHEVLRSVVAEQQGRGMQQVLDVPPVLQITDASGVEAGALSLLIGEEISRPFGLDREGPIRVSLYVTGERQWLLIAVIHHIAFDGWSLPILVRELAELYRSACEQRPAALSPLPFQYGDYARWQRGYLQGELLEKKLGYWKQQLAGWERLELATDHPRRPEAGNRGGVVRGRLEGSLLEALDRLSATEGVTLFMTLLTVFKILLYRYTGQQDIVVGSPVAGRDQQELEGLIGFFVNTVVLRSHIRPEARLEELLQQEKQVTLAAYEHQDVPFEKIVEALGVERDLNRQPMIDVMFILQNIPSADALDLRGVTISAGEIGSVQSKFDFQLDAQETEMGLEMSIVYNCGLFRAETMQGLLDHYIVLLGEASGEAGRERPVGCWRMVDEGQQRQLLEWGRGPEVSGELIAVPLQVERMAAAEPEAIALVEADRQWSYGQLDAAANRVAHWLRSHGVGQEAPVPVCLERSAWQVIALLGCWKAGAAFVPIDPSYPAGRIGYMVEDSGAAVLLTTAAIAGSLRSAVTPGEGGVFLSGAGLLLIDVEQEDIDRQPGTRPDIDIGGRGLAYILYTSGSMGRPKGVMIEHQSLSGYIQNARRLYVGVGDDGGMDGRYGSYGHLSFSFDAAQTALWVPLTSGRSLVLGSGSGAEALSSETLYGRGGYDLLKVTPGQLALLGEQWRSRGCPGSKWITARLVVGGEALRRSQYDFLSRAVTGVRLYNEYGPTEATVGCCVYEEECGAAGEQTEEVPIGRPMAGVRIYIMDEQLNLVPTGVMGEIYIGGVQVARGYWEQPELTAERFVKDPFAGEGRMYRTGDLGRWRRDGQIEYLGRRDGQVKIRGYRIELGEIEAVLGGMQEVGSSAVVVVGDDGSSRLAAFVTAGGEGGVDAEVLLEKLRQQLPEYMVPWRLEVVESLPLTPNGKTDRSALTALAVELSGGGGRMYAPPTNEIERLLVGVWQELLGIPSVGIHDNFFELGGHSLLAMRLSSQIRKQLVRDMPVRTLFLFPTIAGQARQILLAGSQDGAALPPVVAWPRVSGEAMPLSFAQERLWFIDRLQGSVQYHMPWVFRLEGDLRPERLGEAFDALVQRHEVLRSVVAEQQGRGMQQVLDVPPVLQITDASGVEAGALSLLIGEEISRPFGLDREGPIRVSLYVTGERQWLLIAVIHHIAFDGWSLPILVRELAELYRSACEQRPAALSPLPFQYGDYARWQRGYLQGELLEKKLGYWKQQLAGWERLELATDHPRRPEAGNRGGVVRGRLEGSLLEALDRLSATEGVTLFMTLLTVFKILLYRYTGQQDIVVGSPVAGRDQQELEGLIGFFVNTVVLRSHIRPEARLEELLQQEKQVTLAAYEHQDVPFEKIVEALGVERERGRQPFFDMLFSWQTALPSGGLDLGEVLLSQVDSGEQAAQFDGNVNLLETPTGLEMNIVYNCGLFRAETMQGLLDHYIVLLGEASGEAGRERPVGCWRMVDEGQQRQLLEWGRGPEVSGELIAVPLQVERMAAAEPEAIALVEADRQWSYGQLDAAANRVAHWLRSHGVGQEAPVPVCLERSAWQVIALLGCWKAGAAFVPIDPSYPAGRIGYMVEDSGAAVLLTTAAIAGSLRSAVTPGEGGVFLSGAGLLLIDVEQEDIDRQPGTRPDIDIGGRGLAYILYTSGSMGRPKGVMIEHQSLSGYIQNARRLYVGVGDDGGMDGRYGSYGHLSFSFDAAQTALWVPLTSGRSLVLGSGSGAEALSSETLYGRGGYDLLKVTPGQLALLGEQWRSRGCPGSKWITARLVVGGEALRRSQYDFLSRAVTGVRLYNEYGPTEATVGCCVYEEECGAAGEQTEEVPIGRPMAGVRIYIMDEQLNLVPTGVMGEIYIGGVQVARGYWEQPELTAERFVKDPFAGEGRMYRTGDLGRWRRDGQIEYLGRRDGQVKIRGYRIELGEIEAVLGGMQEVGSSAVVVVGDDGSSRLAAFVTAGGEGGVDAEVLLEKLRQQLPEYMVPWRLEVVESLPLTPNGKTDRSALTALAVELSGGGGRMYAPPTNEIERLLVGVWQELLGIPSVGIHDNFFELGGHSLLAVRVIAALRDVLKQEVEIKEIFDHPTIAGLAAMLALKESSEPASSIIFGARPERLPLSFAQERLWFIDRLQGSVQYHMPWVFHIQGEPDIAALEKAFRHLVNRHELLRTLLQEEDGTAFQVIGEKDRWQMEYKEAPDEESDDALQQEIAEIVARPFDLSGDSLLRVVLIKRAEDEYVLIVVMHHIASDGWSLSIIVRELVQSYRAYREGRWPDMPELPVQYADYSVWQRRELEDERMDIQLGWWRNRLRDVAQLNLPTDFPRPIVQSTRGMSQYFTIDPVLSRKLTALSRERGVTLFMTTLTVFKVLLYRYTGQEDICVGSATAGRRYRELEGLVGFFVNTLALRSSIMGEDSFDHFLGEVKETVLDAYMHRDTPFEKIVEAVSDGRDVSRNAVFQVIFALQNTPAVPDLTLGDLIITRKTTVHETAKYDLAFELRESGESIQLRVEYCTDLFQAETIRRMAAHYQLLLAEVVDNPHQQIRSLPMLQDIEKRQVLTEFNQRCQPENRQDTIVSLFRKQVHQWPEAIALVCGDTRLSYAELDRRTDRLGVQLRAAGVAQDMIVGLYADRSIGMIVGMLGILKAGGAYTPVDPSYPEERVRLILQDSHARIVVTTASLHNKWVPVDGIRCIVADETISGELSMQAEENGYPLPQDLAYVIYTSGSTGAPKGVLIEHRNVVSLVKNQAPLLRLRPGICCLQFASFTFDASCYEIFCTLLVGGRLILASKEMLQDATQFSSCLLAEEVNLVVAAPSYLAAVSDLPMPVETVLSAGEALSENLTRKMLFQNIRLLNGYGPTENTVCVTVAVAPLNPCGRITIGRPVGDVRAYILDEERNLVAPGVIGELYFGGRQVGKGYLNQPGRTAERFMEDPFTGEPGDRMYRTGDIGRWLPDGNIELLGRRDQQVKIRGYRIELGEVEMVMNGVPEVATGCAAKVADLEHSDKLIGFYVPDPASVRLREKELRRKRVESWTELNEMDYDTPAGPASGDKEFDVSGWNDSFTAQAIPLGQMREWQDDIIGIILSGKPRNVLEIGCGSGLIYYRLAPFIKRYTGTDLTDRVTDRIRQHITGAQGYCPTTLMVCPADEISLPDGEEMDTIILNSVIQYFPSEEYLLDVLSRCLSILRGKGRIIVGDIRDLRLLQAFKALLFVNRTQSDMGKDEFVWRMEQQIAREEELCVSPGLFHRWKESCPEISHIDLLWKDMRSVNELSAYRYTVIIHAGVPADGFDPGWQEWPGSEDRAALLRRLEVKGNFIAFSDVPNPRLARESRWQEAIDRQTVVSVRDLAAYLQKPDVELTFVEEFIDAAETRGYKCRRYVAGNALRMHLVLYAGESLPECIRMPQSPAAFIGAACTNTPLLSDIFQSLPKTILQSMARRLPEFMMPSELIAVTALPVRISGKIDRAMLRRYADGLVRTDRQYRPASTYTEHALVRIWEGLLGITPISIRDDFFAIGGHSLLATRLISAIRKEFGKEVRVRDIFIHSSIAGLAQHIEQSDRANARPAIPLRPTWERAPLSFAQERLWFIDRLQGSVQYNMSWAFRLEGDLQPERLAEAVDALVQRHQVLRTILVEQEGMGVQLVLEGEASADWQEGAPGLQKPLLRIIDSYPTETGSLPALIEEEVNRSFRLDREPPIRVSLLALGEQRWLLIAVIHHIAFDGWSLPILVQELAEFYRSACMKRPAALAPLPFQYADYAAWQRSYLQGDLLEQKLAYWRQQLAGWERLALPTDHPRRAEAGTRGGIVRGRLDKSRMDMLARLSAAEGVTMFMTLLTVFKILLNRYTGQQDILVGSPVAGRDQQELEQLIGFFVNTLVIRSCIGPAVGLHELLQQEKLVTLAAYEHQDVPFEKVVEAMSVERDMSRQPLIDVMFALQNIPSAEALDLGGVAISTSEPGAVQSKFDLQLDALETATGLELSIVYSRDLYEPETIQEMLDHYIILLGEAATESDPHRPVSRWVLLADTERQRLLDWSHGPQLAISADRTSVPLLIERIAMGQGQDIALGEGERWWSYAEFDAAANRLANWLRSYGLMEGSLLPICLERSAALVIALLGCWKAGAAYIPIDPAYPPDRIAYMVADTGAALMLTTTDIAGSLASAVTSGEGGGFLPGVGLLLMDEQADIIAGQPGIRPDVGLRADQLAYIIYTSGSTGRPKGVMVEHGSIVNLVDWYNPYYHVDKHSRSTPIAGVAFDALGWELWTYLTAGATVILMSEAQRLTPASYPEWYQRNGITHAFMPTALVYDFMKGIRDRAMPLRYLMTGGEQLSLAEVEATPYGLIDNYGPTEVTMIATCCWLSGTSGLGSIGRPIANTTGYILDEHGSLAPAGVPGELYLGGVQVARGYWNQPGLTAEKFVPDTFDTERPGAMLYRTGDLVRWRRDGNIEYLGRRDNQVKIRGYRIEPGEIEAVLQDAPGITAAVVVPVTIDDTGSRRLVAYVTGEAMGEAVMEYAGQRLPGYMLPSRLEVLDVFPLTQNGKVDRAALTEKAHGIISSISNEYAAPHGEAESALVSVWQELLGAERIGVHDNFFELGGDSIITIQVVSRMKRDGFTLRPRDFFLHQTINKLAILLSRQSALSDSHPADQGRLEGLCGLLPIQQWYLKGAGEERSHYNQSVLLSIDKRVDTQVLRRAILALADQHDALRFHFHRSAEGWEQRYGETNIQMEEVVLKSGDWQQQMEARCSEVQAGLDLEAGRVMGVCLFRTPEPGGKDRLLCAVHHLVVDGVSWRILFDDLEILLRDGPKLSYAGSKTCSYRRYHESLVAYGQSARGGRQREYWSAIVSQYHPLPTDLVCPQPPFVGDSADEVARLSQDLTRKLLQEVPPVYHTEINDILVAVLASALSQWAGLAKMTVGLEGHGREDLSQGIDVSRTVGWFTTVYPVVLTLPMDGNSGDLIKSIKEQLRQVPDKGIGFGVLKYLLKDEALQGREGFDILFNYLGQVDNVVARSQWFGVAMESSGENIHKNAIRYAPLEMNCIIVDGELIMNWTYSRLQYHRATIQRLVMLYTTILQEVIGFCLETGRRGSFFTPSDHGLSNELSYGELDQFINGEGSGLVDILDF